MNDAIVWMMELRQKGYYCSQILLLLALRLQGKENPDLVRAMSGLARGTTGRLGVCGTLTGAACLLAFYAARGSDEEKENDQYPGMLKELWTWFEETYGSQYGGVTCGEILSDGTDPRQRCGPIIAETYAKAMDILTSHGFDPTVGKEG